MSIIYRTVKEFDDVLRNYCLGGGKPQGFGQTWNLEERSEIKKFLEKLAQQGNGLKIHTPGKDYFGLDRVLESEGRITLVTDQDQFVVVNPKLMSLHVNSNPLKDYVALGFLETYENKKAPLVITAAGSIKPREKYLFECVEEIVAENAEKLRTSFDRFVKRLPTSTRVAGLRAFRPVYDLEKEDPALTWRLNLPASSDPEEIAKSVEEEIWRQKRIQNVTFSIKPTGLGNMIDFGVLFETP